MASSCLAQTAKGPTISRVQVKKNQAKSHTAVLTITGMTEAYRVVTLRAETQGRVVKIPVEYGQEVKEGDTLVVLDSDDRPARLAEAEALVEQRKKEYEAGVKLEAKKFRATNQLAANKAAYDAAKARLAQIMQEIGDTKIQAPFAGVFDRKTVEVGDFVDRGNSVATVLELDPLKVICSVSEKDIVAILKQVNKPNVAKVILGEEKKERDLTITYVSKNADTRTRTYQVELRLDNPDNKIPAGLTTKVMLVKEEIKAHLISLASITLADDGVPGVKVVNDKRVKFIPIEIVDSSPNGMVWIKGPPDEIVLITVGAGYVIDGQEVTPVFEDEKNE